MIRYLMICGLDPRSNFIIVAEREAKRGITTTFNHIALLNSFPR
jgi:hypothetical protein